MDYISKYGFHDAALSYGVTQIAPKYHGEPQFTYTFRNFFHPFVGEMISEMNHSEVPIEALLAPGTQAMTRTFFDAIYHPKNSGFAKVATPLPVKNIDINANGPYAAYNWELFFHIPMTIAVHLSKSRRFAEAQHWFHYIFNPTSHDTSLPPQKRFWNFRAFRMDADPQSIDELLTLLSKAPGSLSDEDKERQKDILAGYEAMLHKAFNPHAVARTRHVAYQYNVVMKYLDNLIAWGDDLFQQYTIETINEATQLYVLANNILGPRPEKVPPVGTVQIKTFAQLKAQGLDQMGNTLVELEAAFPFNMTAPNAGSPGSSPEAAGPLFGIGHTLYFCIPRNQKLLSYWESVADRLFKIRHCQDISGVVRPLALYEPRIDPGMLVAAAAAGLDIGSIVSGLNQPVGPVRSLFLVQKALELASEVKSLGAALLGAIEKGDAEHMARTRQAHEIQLHRLTLDTRFLQWKAAQESATSLLTSRRAALERLQYFGRLLGLPADQNAKDIAALNFGALTAETFDEAYGKLVAAYDKPIGRKDLPALKLAGDTSPAQQSGASGPGKLYLSANENDDLNVQPPLARSARDDAMHSDTVTALLTLIPDMGIDLHFWGMGGHLNVFGGSTLASAGRFFSSIRNTEATQAEAKSVSSSKTAGLQRRADDWLLQYNLAAHEVMQNGRQILGALISEQIAQHEHDAVQQQLDNAIEIAQIMQDKFSNEDTYLWMQGELSKLYYDYYRLAFDYARRAEKTVKTELMRSELDDQNFVRFNYWDAGHKGLLAGEALHLDLKRLELAYHDNNKREFELTRHISLRQLDPLALLQLKTSGTCRFTVPEWLFDRDCPGHYMRRIKSVALSIPSVAGPYNSLNCTATLLSSTIRKSPLLMDGEYLRQGTEDNRFVDYAGAMQSIVTSSASNDSGLFETNLRDERFLPFEGGGAAGTWQLDLPGRFPSVNTATFSDVILHMRYTARPGVQIDKVNTAVTDLFAETTAENGANLALMYSLRHDFPTEWSAFVHGQEDLKISIGRDLDFPYFADEQPVTLLEFQLFSADGKHHQFGDPAARSADLQGGSFELTAPPDPAGPTQVLTRNDAKDVFLIVRYALG